jgi:hypothetical protein
MQGDQSLTDDVTHRMADRSRNMLRTSQARLAQMALLFFALVLCVAPLEVAARAFWCLRFNVSVRQLARILFSVSVSGESFSFAVNLRRNGALLSSRHPNVLDSPHIVASL